MERSWLNSSRLFEITKINLFHWVLIGKEFLELTGPIRHIADLMIVVCKWGTGMAFLTFLSFLYHLVPPFCSFFFFFFLRVGNTRLLFVFWLLLAGHKLLVSYLRKHAVGRIHLLAWNSPMLFFISQLYSIQWLRWWLGWYTRDLASRLPKKRGSASCTVSLLDQPYLRLR